MASLKRITDLFTEGTELVLGEDESGTPVVVWVAKLNSFEDEDARQDGLAARAEKTLAMNSDNPEVHNLRSLMERWDKDDLIANVAALKSDEDYLKALDDIDSDEEWREKLVYLRRMDTLHDDASIPEDDERRTKFTELNQEYYRALREFADKRQADRRRELADTPMEDLRQQYIDGVIDRFSMDAFMAERKVTEIFYCARECNAVKVEGGWNHEKCDHTQKLMASRAEVRTLPEELLNKIINTLSSITVDRRTAGNSDAPPSSSGSSEQLSLEEESSPSTQEVTAPVVV